LNKSGVDETGRFSTMQSDSGRSVATISSESVRGNEAPRVSRFYKIDLFISVLEKCVYETVWWATGTALVVGGAE
jgi:hypothetical protein